MRRVAAFLLTVCLSGGVFADITAEDDRRLEEASKALIRAYNLLQEVRQEGGQVPAPKPDKEDWQCYLDRYDDVRRNGPYTSGWANRHWANWGKNERRTWGCKDEDDDAVDTGKKPWHHSNQDGSFGTSVNLCEQYAARSVSLNGEEWRYHRRDKGREVWHDRGKRSRLHGEIRVVLKDGQVLTATLEPGSGIRYTGDC